MYTEVRTVSVPVPHLVLLLCRYVMSGDSEGRCFFWEWGAPQKIVRTIKAHEAVCIGCEWNPLETSKVATCGWDGLIKYWD